MDVNFLNFESEFKKRKVLGELHILKRGENYELKPPNSNLKLCSNSISKLFIYF